MDAASVLMQMRPLIVLIVFLCSLYLSGSCSSGMHHAFNRSNREIAPSCDAVDISSTIISKRKDPVFDFGRVQFRRSEAGGSPIYELSDGAYLSYEGKRYTVRFMRMAAPSEHRVLGMPFLMELQFFAFSDDSSILALSMFVRKGKKSSTLRSMIVSASGEISLSGLKPDYGGHYYYKGALPVPPCYRIPYVVMKSAVEAAPEDMDEYLRRWPYAERSVGKPDLIEETE
jgi:hypothetical protein